MKKFFIVTLFGLDCNNDYATEVERVYHETYIPRTFSELEAAIGEFFSSEKTGPTYSFEGKMADEKTAYIAAVTRDDRALEIIAANHFDRVLDGSVYVATGDLTRSLSWKIEAAPIVPLKDSTPRELREGMNLRRLFLAGEFNSPAKTQNGGDARD